MQVATTFTLLTLASANCEHGVCNGVEGSIESIHDGSSGQKGLFQSRQHVLGKLETVAKVDFDFAQQMFSQHNSVTGVRAGNVGKWLLDDEPLGNISTDDRICEKDIFARPDLCPAHCPFAAEMAQRFCHFRCVKDFECGLLGTMPKATIPDEKHHLCRHCNVEACLTCVAGKPGQKGKELERCITCMSGYYLTKEGECGMYGLWVFIAMSVNAAIIAMILIAWYLRILTRPCINQEGVNEGIASRSRARLLQEREAVRTPYPLRTNLLSTNVAGLGTICFFRFQFAILVWAITLLAAWFGFAFFVSSDLLILGNRPATSPQMLCAIIRWGHTRQIQLLWTKVAWLGFAYMFSFSCSLVYAIEQTWLVFALDAANVTMSDFAAVLRGLPQIKGTEQVETLIKNSIEKATGERVVGVSVAWDYDSCASAVMHELDKDLLPVQQSAGTTHHPSAPPPKTFDTPITHVILDAWHVHLHDGHQREPSDSEMKQIVMGLNTASMAFVIFDKESARDMAVEWLQGTGIKIHSASCTLEECSYEPREVMWGNLSVTPGERKGMLFRGTLFVFGACLGWTFILYLPYAFYMSSFSYANGDEPGRFSEYLFICLVVCSQLGLFAVSSMVAKRARFHFSSHTQKTYMLFYTSALILNLALDIVLQGYLSYLQMVGVHAHTASGHLLGELTQFQQVFESYPMQKSLGKLFFNYCWPCTFLVPFLLEPVCVQWLPQHIARLLVGTDPRIRGINAMKAFELGEMEQGRYADMIFNLVLVACIPFLSPAYMHMVFGALIVSHLYIYCYDHVKVLRYVVKFEFDSSKVHHLGVQLFALPVGIFAGAFVFKANQLTGMNDIKSSFLQGYWLGLAIAGAVVGHVLLHLLLLSAIRHMCSRHVDRSNSKAMYADVARQFPATYFSKNPIHCLRSRYGINQEKEVQKYYSPLQG